MQTFLIVSTFGKEQKVCMELDLFQLTLLFALSFKVFLQCSFFKTLCFNPGPSLALSAENNALHITSSHFRTRTSYQSSTRAALIAFHLGYAENQLLLLRSSVEGKDKTDVCAGAASLHIDFSNYF